MEVPPPVHSSLKAVWLNNSWIFPSLFQPSGGGGVLSSWAERLKLNKKRGSRNKIFFMTEVIFGREFTEFWRNNRIASPNWGWIAYDRWRLNKAIWRSPWGRAAIWRLHSAEGMLFLIESCCA